MKIAIPSDDKVKIAPKFDEAKGFIIYELDNKLLVNFEYKERLDGVASEDASDHNDELIKLLDGCSSVICNKIDSNIRQGLAQKNIKVLKTIESNAKKAVLNLFCSTD